MSLINDALKRASTSRPMLTEAQTLPLMQPVQEGSRGAGPLPIVLFIVGVGALLVSGGFWLKSNGTPPQAAVIPEPVQIATPAPAPALVAAETITTNLPLPTVSPTLAAEIPASDEPTVVAEEQKPVAKPSRTVAATTGTKPTEAAVQRAAEAQPDFSLQAIYYRMKGPTVVINGKTLKVGDTIAGAKLVAIERTAAEIISQGTRRKLTLQ
jgi:hypothetical protein